MRVIRILSALLLAALLLSPAAASAQDHRPSPPLVKWGKWALLAGSVGMNLLAADAHDEADDVFAQIEARCAGDASLCFAGDDGRYLDAGTEALYQQSLRHDRRARAWLIGGQGALVGAAALFIWEFTRPKALPENIPFDPELEVTARETRLRLNLAF